MGRKKEHRSFRLSGREARPRPGKNSRGIVTLITDFGLGGEYTGAMKGAILNINPSCQIVDITHAIPPQKVLQAAFVLRQAYSYFPPGTVHMVVVDPGVGTSRRPIVLGKEGYFFVGPDNGVFTFLLDGEVAGYELARTEYFLSPVSATFHGRDIFAPVAAYLSLGFAPRRLGPRVTDLARASWPVPRRQGRRLQGKILYTDAFGNLVTNIDREEYGPLLTAQPLVIRGKGWSIAGLSRTYGEVPPGRPLALFGSSGLLEIAVREGDARRQLALDEGDGITVTLPAEPRRREGRGK